MNILLFIGFSLLIILCACNRIYLKKLEKDQQQKLENLQLILWGYSGEPSKDKKDELYQKYLSVYKNQCKGEINLC